MIYRNIQLQLQSGFWGLVNLRYGCEDYCVCRVFLLRILYLLKFLLQNVKFLLENLKVNT